MFFNMNDMPTQFNNSIALEQSNAIEIVHKLRGEYLSYCADVEHWMMSALQYHQSSNPSQKPPILFGQKFENLQKITNIDAGPFKKPAKVRALLSELSAYVSMRSWLGHSRITFSHNGPDMLLHFALPGDDPAFPEQFMKTISKDDFININKKLKNLAKRITDQRLNSQ